MIIENERIQFFPIHPSHGIVEATILRYALQNETRCLKLQMQPFCRKSFENFRDRVRYAPKLRIAKHFISAHDETHLPFGKRQTNENNLGAMSTKRKRKKMR